MIKMNSILLKNVLSSYFWVWFGIIIGLSFMATPIKFTASQLDLPVALEVGKVTFQFLAKIERILALGLVVALIVKPRPIIIILVLLMSALLLLQQLWLMPALYERVDIIMAGKSLAGSSIHFYYIFSEICKLIVLSALAIMIKIKAK